MEVDVGGGKLVDKEENDADEQEGALEVAFPGRLVLEVDEEELREVGPTMKMVKMTICRNISEKRGSSSI